MDGRIHEMMDFGLAVAVTSTSDLTPCFPAPLITTTSFTCYLTQLHNSPAYSSRVACCIFRFAPSALLTKLENMSHLESALVFS